MIYELVNIENDDFVAEVLSELEEEVRNGKNENIILKEVADSNRNIKGTDIAALVIQITNWCSANEPFLESVVGGLIAAGVYDILKSIVFRLRRMPEYAHEKKIEIVQKDDEGHKQMIVITMEDIIEKDKR